MGIYDPRYNRKETLTPGSGGSGTIDGSDMSRILPRQVSTGTLRGTQNVGYGATKIDGSNNRITLGDIVLDGNTSTINIGDNIILDGKDNSITVTSDDGSQIGFGPIPGYPGEFGLFSIDMSGNLIMKIVNGTWYVFRVDKTNVMQSGILPDKSAGWAVAASGYNVSQGY